MREIVLDTETTGLKPADGHRIVEIGCVELMNHLPTGERRQWYINPERDMPAEAFAVHGLSNEFLAGFPVFAAIASEVLDFLGDSRLIIHNAAFDMTFLNAEFARLGLPPLPADRALDTVQLARRRFPGAPASLDALCRRFGIDSSERTLHGALLDSQLLAECYLELLGGRQTGFDLSQSPARSQNHEGRGVPVERPFVPPRPHAPTPDELAAHETLLAQLKSPLWRQKNA